MLVAQVRRSGSTDSCRSKRDDASSGEAPKPKPETPAARVTKTPHTIKEQVETRSKNKLSESLKCAPRRAQTPGTFKEQVEHV